MKVLFLGHDNSPIVEYLNEIDEEVVVLTEILTIESITALNPDFLISYGYRYIIKQNILDYFAPNRAINLHISYLPWNRGADPNLWSFIENTIKGVTIHYLDSGVDTGDIIAQHEVTMADYETLSTSYRRLHENIVALFKIYWKEIKSGKCPRMKQVGVGTFHKSREKDPYMKALTHGFDTNVTDLKKIVTTQRSLVGEGNPI
jgi:methionyl-tRNA formyltransferase